MYVGARRTQCFVAYISAIFHVIFAQRCPNGAPSTFTKISSMVPRTTVPPILLFASATPGTAVTAECYNRCRRSDDCAGFIVDYHRASCFRVSAADTSLPDQVSLLPERSSNFFLKTCVQVPVNCTQKVWAFEYSPNSELIGYQQHVIPNVADQWQCAQLCLNGAKQYRYGQNAPCYSAQYQHWSKTCMLSSETRRTKPEAFNPIVQEGVDYIENLCLAENDPNSVGCWHEPIYNYTLEHIDLQIPDLNLEQCRERCETEQSFACRGFTHRCLTNPNYGLETICYLHSDDTLTSGPLIYRPCTTYVERLTCIDLKVECSVNKMVLTLHYKGFSGRMFAVGYADECGIDGNNHDVTTLVLPITNDPRTPNPCGIVVAHSVGYGNRKLATAIIAIQRHPIIQTLGDRIAKVTCIAEEPSDRLPRPLFKNITLDATFGVAEPPVQTSIVNEIANISSISPTARLRILDLSRGGAEAAETLLGEELELRVDIYPPFNTSMLRAGHLVASSGDGRDSFLLLDWRGCPPDPSTFPALTPKGATVLSAIFKAFRFPSSPILKFSLILTICDGICQPTDCGNGLTSWGRKKRATDDDLNKQEVPLQLAIIVRSPEPEEVYNSTDMISLFSTTDAESEESPCVSWPAMMTAMLIFGTAQIVLLAICTVMYYRKKRLLNDQVKLNNDFHPRHVKWADQ